MDLTEACWQLRDHLSDLHIGIGMPHAEMVRTEAAQIADQIGDYIVPRLKNLDAPMLAVVGGSTGAGKSTLVNSLLRRCVTRPGVIRPTTKAPVLIYSSEDEQWFTSSRILPDLQRISIPSDDQRSLQLVPEPSLPAGLAIIDAPDIDSVVEDNRLVASQLLDAADLWIFVTSAARYSDAVPWEFLTKAAQRGTAIAVVVDRVPPSAMGVIPADLGRMMSLHGLGKAPLFAVPETVSDAEGLLPDGAVAPIRSYLAGLAANRIQRDALVKTTLSGAITSVIERSSSIVKALEEHEETMEYLRDQADKIYRLATEKIHISTSDGTLLRGEVLARWHDYVGTTDLMRSFDHRISRLRDRIVGFFSGQPDRGDDIGLAAGSGLEILVKEKGYEACEQIWQIWYGNPTGRLIVRKHADLARVSASFDEEVQQAIRSWQAGILDLISEQGQKKRMTARIMALGLNGVGAALMLVIFANTGGVTGAEGGVAIGTSVLAQRLLESIFGDEAVRQLAQKAKADLDALVDALIEKQVARFTQCLDSYQRDSAQVSQLAHVVECVDRLYRTEGIGNEQMANPETVGEGR